MIAIALIGIGIGTLVRPTQLGAVILNVLLLTMLLTAILGLLFRRGSKRAYWTGFAVFGWAYLMLAFFLFWEKDLAISPMPIREVIAGSLIPLLEFLLVPGLGDSEKTGDLLASLHGFATKVDNESRFVVAWSLLGLAFAALGGTVARGFSSNAATSTGPESTSSPARGAAEVPEAVS
jgi:hypothetical protein